MKKSANQWVLTVITAVLIAAPSCCRAAAQLAASTEPATRKSGAFETSFNERSPRSAPLEIAKRMGYAPSDVAGDYSLSAQKFLIYVPPKMAGAKPLGMLAILTITPIDSFTPELQDEANADHLILAMPKDYNPNPWQMAGLLLDAAFNLQKDYGIDPQRTYLLVIDDSHFTTFAVENVYTGVISPHHFIFWGFKNSQGEFVPHDQHVLPADVKAQSKRVPYVFVNAKNETDGYKTRIAAALRLMGCTVRSITAAPQDLDFPKYEGNWLKEAVAFLDASQPTPIVTQSIPTSRTTAENAARLAAKPGEAVSLLSLAKAYLASGHPEIARPKLQQVIDRFPTTPSADEARQLLSQMGQSSGG